MPKNTGKKSTGRTTAGTGSKKRGRPSKAEMKKAEINRAWSIVIFALGILWLGICFVPGEAVWEQIKIATFGAFGTVNYFIGIMLIYLAVLTAMGRPVKWKMVETAVCIMLISSLIHILGTAFTAEEARVLTIKGLYEQGAPLTFTGGAVAGFITIPLITNMGIAPAAIVVAVLTLVFVMMLTDTTPYDVYKRTKAEAEKQKADLEKSMADAKEHRAAKQAEREKLAAEKAQAEKAAVQQEKPKSRTRKIDFEIDDPVAEKDDIVGVAAVNGFDETFSDVHMQKQLEQQKIEEIMKKLNLTNDKEEPKEEEQPQHPAEEAKAEGENTNGENAETKPYVYRKPPITLFDRPSRKSAGDVENELKTNAQLLVDTLASFGVQTKIIDISRGPSVTRYELQPLAGVKISKITNLADDIALNLAASGVRIEAPIPNKAAVGIEVPNKASSSVNIRSIFESKEFKESKSPLSIALGVDIAGNVVVADLTRMPHLLIAGSTGSGKSVCINAVITSFLYKSSPEDVKLILIDPKVVELAEYNGIPHLLMPVVTEPKKAAGALGSAVAEMEKRYKLFAETGVREIKSYNKLAETREDLEKLPYVAIVIDELADLMMVAGKEVEDYICRIAQKARAAGMHLIVATQRPSVDVITGLIKANIPARIAFAVSSQVDSRTILDGGGAEKLLGMGDMLYLPLGASKPIRVQGTYVKDDEIGKVIDFIKTDYVASYNEEMISSMENIAAASTKGGAAASDGGEQRDEMIHKAIETVVDAGQASTSLLQRKLKLGYARAARIMDEMEEMGIIGPYEGSKPRQVLITKAQWLEMMVNNNNEQ
ncbi:MAG: DNA translocase FtsK [Oscillospiraceae bacterium]|nr:DNA translocase FtsK [Oscillospiraceae bacterium]